MTDSFNIIMNPPYDGSLHLQILEKALTFKSDNGTCICLHPNTFRLHLDTKQFHKSKSLLF